MRRFDSRVLKKPKKTHQNALAFCVDVNLDVKRGESPDSGERPDKKMSNNIGIAGLS